MASDGSRRPCRMIRQSGEKIGIRLVILAALGVIAQIISTIAAWW
jgi:hypothetical protein